MDKEELEDLGYAATIEMIDGEKYIKISSTRPRRESNIKEIFDELDVEEIIKEIENNFDIK